MELTHRERILKLFQREKIDRLPLFSGMGNITVHGLEEHGWKFSEIHTDARKMASMAESTYRLFGFECAVVPFDLGVEAEALGAGVNFYPHHDDILYPTISRKLAEKIEDLNIQVPPDLSHAGRIPLVLEALQILKNEVGNEIVIGAHVLGPYTLAGQLVDIGFLAKSAFKRTALVREKMDQLSDVLIQIIGLYRNAGADYVAVREMGAGGDILSPRMFNILIRPCLEKIFKAIESPKILHMCGDTDGIIDQMDTCGADAISVDHKNHLAESRKKINPKTLLFGHIDGFGIMVNSTPEDVEKAVEEAVNGGVDAIWPGCDIWPTVPKENMQALVAATQKLGSKNRS